MNRTVRLATAMALLWLGGATVSAQELLRSSSDWTGTPITYPDGTAQITSIILSIDEGEEPPFHCHPVPTFGYVLKGTVEVETRDGKRARFSAGQSVVEVLRSVHRGRAVDGPVEIVVFYAGAEGMPTTVRPEDDPEHRYCDA